MAGLVADRVLVELEARVDRYNRDINAAAQNFDRRMAGITRDAGKAEQRLNASFTRMGSGLKLALGAFAGGFAIGGLSQLPSLIRETVASAAGIKDVADQIGLTTERLQELRFAADQSGIGAAALDEAMAQFSRRIGEAAAGTGDLRKVLEANGVALRTADGSLRPLNDLLAEYATLLANASSDQDRLALAVDAFGRGGATMVNLLRDGASGLDALSTKAREAGAVLSDDLVQAAADVDDKFAELQARFTTFVQSSIVTFVGDVRQVMDDLAGAADAAANAWANFEAVYNRVFQISPEDAAKGKLTAALNRQSATGNYGQDVDYGLSFPQAPKGNRPSAAATVVPTKPGDGRGSATDDIQRQKKAVDDLIASLQFEASLVGKSDIEQQVANELRRAGAAATAGQREEIEALVRSNYALEEAQKSAETAQRALNQVLKRVGDTAGDALSRMIVDGEKASDVIRSLVADLARAAIKMAAMSAVQSLFGGGDIGKIGTNAAGTNNWRGGPTWVGEKGPEIVNLPRGAQVIPNSKLGGGNLQVVVNNAPAPVAVKEEQTPQGRRLRLDFEDMVLAGASSPRARRHLGLSTPVVKRA